MLRLFGALLIAASSLSAQSPRWLQIHTDTEFTIALDTTHITETAASRYEMWFEWSYAKPKMFGDGPTATPYSKSLNEWRIDCQKRQFIQLDAILYSANGSVAASIRGDSARWMDAPPESVGESVILMACSVASGAYARGVRQGEGYVRQLNGWVRPVVVRDSVRRARCRSTKSVAIKQACAEYSASDSEYTANARTAFADSAYRRMLFAGFHLDDLLGLPPVALGPLPGR